MVVIINNEWMCALLVNEIETIQSLIVNHAGSEAVVLSHQLTVLRNTALSHQIMRLIYFELL
jgi:ABC-type nitrate/sulfonate/bicarbonate transport system ATPase subunit